MRPATIPALFLAFLSMMAGLGPAGASALTDYPPQPAGLAWPTENWTVAEPGPGVDRAALEAAMDRSFSGPLEGTRSVIAVHRGRIVAERYAPGIRPDQRQISHSTAKPITAVLAGILARQGRIDPFAPAPVATWRCDPGDPRAKITLANLLHMSSGLEWTEDYVDMLSDVVVLLAGVGYDDQGGWVASRPLVHEPGEHFSYSSGTTQLVSSILRDAVGGTREDYLAFMHAELFEPLGMKSAIPEFDPAGTFVGSSWFWAVPRDYARFAYLLLRGGEWNGREIVEESWVNFMRTPAPADNNRFIGGQYGAHTRLWWPGDSDAFGHAGFLGQAIVVVPSKDLVVVRSANILTGGYFEPMVDNLREIVDAFPKMPEPMTRPQLTRRFRQDRLAF